MVKDPVCGMMIDEKFAEAKSEYNGETYYFTSLDNKKTFDEDPAKYTKGETQEMPGDSGMKMKM